MKAGKTKRAYWARTETPLGGLAFAVDGAGRLLAIAFLNRDRKPGIAQTWAKTKKGLEDDGYELAEDASRTAFFQEQLGDYFAGRRRDFDVQVAPRGTEFQRQVWRLLRRIPRGETRSYAELAAAVGRPRAARAVGRAVATNPIPIVIPCHRVVGADGSLTGFAGGLRFKAGLLALEAPLPTAARFGPLSISDGTEPGHGSDEARS